MPKVLKILLIFVAAVITLTAAAIGLFLLQFDASRYKEDLIALVEKQTGRDFAIEGEMHLAPSLLPTLAIEEVRLANPDWAQEPLMLTVGRLETRIALLPLLGGDIAISRIVLVQPVVNLETGKDGAGNWLFATAAGADEVRQQADTGGLPQIEINELQIEKARITYRDAGQSRPTVFTIDHFTAAGALEESLQVDLVASLDQMPANLNGTVGSLAQFLSGANYPLALDLHIGPAEGRIEGKIGKPAQMKDIAATISIRADSLADFSSADQSLPAIGPLEIEGQLQGGLAMLRLSSIKARLADSDLQGEVTYKSAAAQPALTASLTSERLNLVPFQPEKKEEKQKNKKIFSSQKIDLKGLRTVDANVTLKAARVLTRDANLSDLQLQLTIDSSDLRLKATGGIAGGELNADLGLNAGGNTPHLNARLAIRNMLPEEMPAFQEDPVIRDGRTDIHFDGRGAGPSPAAIAGSLDGKLLVTIGKGKLMNKVADVAGTDVIFSTFRMLNPLSEQEDDSTLNCGVLNFHIKDGMAQAKDGIALQTSKVNVLGSGAVDLKTEAIDFRAKPQAREGLGVNLAQLTDVMHIGGTISNPRPEADVKGALKTAGTVGAAVATGGLSLVAQGLFSRNFSTDDPCGVALGKKDPGRSEAGGSDGTEDNSTADKAKTKLKEAGDKVKGVLDNLFGK